MNNKNLIPYIDYKDNRYEFVATRAVRVKYLEMQRKNIDTIKLGLKLNRLGDNVKECKVRFDKARADYANSNNEQTLSQYTICANELNLAQSQYEDFVAEMAINGDIQKAQIKQAEDIAFEMLKEKYGLMRDEFNLIIANFREEQGEEIADEFMLAMVDTVFTMPEAEKKTSNEFLNAYRANRKI